MVGASTGALPTDAGRATPFTTEEAVLLNPGSVGQSRQRERLPRARFALLDLERREARFFAEPYDVTAAREALRKHSLPRSCIQVRPERLPALPRRAATGVRAARRRMSSG